MNCHWWQAGTVEWSATEEKEFWVYEQADGVGAPLPQPTSTIKLNVHSAKFLNWLTTDEQSKWLQCRGALNLNPLKCFSQDAVIVVDRSLAYRRTQPKDKLWDSLSPEAMQKALF